jgi:hypothetical protein
MTLSITTFSIMGLFARHSIPDTDIQHNTTVLYFVECRYAECCDYLIVMLSVIMPNVVMPNAVMLSVVMLSVVMLSVVMLSAVAPISSIHKLRRK